MDSGPLDMLHHGRDKGLPTIANGVGLHLNGFLQKPVDDDGAFRAGLDGRGHVLAE